MKPENMIVKISHVAGTLYASEGRQRVCSPGDHGWVIAGEIWPGQVLSFLRDNASRWRDVKARPSRLAQQPEPGRNRSRYMSSSLIIMLLCLQLASCIATLLLSTATLYPAPLRCLQVCKQPPF